MTEKTLILYSADGCHLCEQVVQMLGDINRLDCVDIVDIVEDDELVEAYGIRIPVMKKRIDNKELGWPFEQSQLIDFIG